MGRTVGAVRTVEDSAEGAAAVADARALLTEHGLVPAVPRALLSDPEALLGRILATPRTSHAPARRTHLAGPARRPHPSQDAQVSRGAHSSDLVRDRTDGTDGTITAGSRPRARTAPLSGTPGPAARRPRRGARRRTVLASFGVVALVLVLAAAQGTSAQPATATPLPSLAYGLADPTTTDPSDLPDARGALLELATAARGASAPGGSGTVQHVVAQEWLSETTTVGPRPADSTTAIYPTVTDRWVAADGSGQITQRRSAAVLPDGSLDTAAGPSSGGASSTDTFLAGTMDATSGTTLSRDPGTLTAELLATSYAECDLATWEAFCLVDQVQSQFLTGVVSPDLTEAFWTVLAEQPDVGLLGTTTDRIGRAGTAIAVAVPTVPEETSDERAVLVLVISEKTGQMLSTEQITVHSDTLGITEPRVVGFSAITRSELTTEVGR